VGFFGSLNSDRGFPPLADSKLAKSVATNTPYKIMEVPVKRILTSVLWAFALWVVPASSFERSIFVDSD
jgi:hypothetical protein